MPYHPHGGEKHFTLALLLVAVTRGSAVTRNRQAQHNQMIAIAMQAADVMGQVIQRMEVSCCSDYHAQSAQHWCRNSAQQKQSLLDDIASLLLRSNMSFRSRSLAVKSLPTSYLSGCSCAPVATVMCVLSMQLRKLCSALDD